MKAVLALVCGVTLATACSQAFDCAQVERLPIEIIPVDVVSGAYVADSVTAVATLDGRPWPLGPHAVDANGRLVSLWGGAGPGRYRVTAQHPRYITWDSTVVVEAAAGCERFARLSLTLRLIPR